MRNARLDEWQAAVNTGRGNINNLRCAADTTLMTETEEELKNLLMRVKEETEKASLKLNIKKKLRSWHRLHHFTANKGGRGGSSKRAPVLGLRIAADGTAATEPDDCFSAGKRRHTEAVGWKAKHSVDKDPHSQGCGLPSGHAQSWELDSKEGRMPKTRCLQTVVLEKTPGSPLKSKEITPGNLKGN